MTIHSLIFLQKYNADVNRNESFREDWAAGCALPTFKNNYIRMKRVVLLLCLIGAIGINELLAQSKPKKVVQKTQVTAKPKLKKLPLVKNTSPDSLDADTGLINETNTMYVKAHCTGCHSAKLILQHRFTREGWQEKIRWMQKYHKLWDLGEAEPLVLNYLERYYSAPKLNPSLVHRQKELKQFIWYKLEQ